MRVEHDCPLFSEQTQESIQRFEQQAGLRDAGYTPHKGLTTEETKYLRVAEALHVSKNGHTDWDCPAKVTLLAEGLNALAADVLFAGLESEGVLCLYMTCMRTL